MTQPPARDPQPADKTEEQIDDMVEDSFPASDPPSTTPVGHVGTPPSPEAGAPPDDGHTTTVAPKPPEVEEAIEALEREPERDDVDNLGRPLESKPGE